MSVVFVMLLLLLPEVNCKITDNSVHVNHEIALRWPGFLFYYINLKTPPKQKDLL